VFPARYELNFHITDDGNLHRHRRENLKSYYVMNLKTSNRITFRENANVYKLQTPILLADE
jgi:hypothetical protein